jgi:rRNA maturation endonuclease Nob1
VLKPLVLGTRRKISRPENTETIKAIKERLNKSFMFNTLNESDLKIVVNAMEEKKYTSGASVIT